MYKTETFCLICTYLISRFCRNFFPQNVNVVNFGDGKCDQAYNFCDTYKLDNNEDGKFSGYAGPICGSGA